MDAGDRRDAALDFAQRRARRRIGDRLRLHADQRGDQREPVGDAVVDLVQQHLGAFLGLAHLALGAVALALQPCLLERLIDGAASSSKNSWPAVLAT